jgi:hypothetical protein
MLAARANRNWWAAVAVMTGVAAGACGGSGPTGPSGVGGGGTTRTLQAVEIEGNAGVAQGATAQLTARARFSDGTTQDVSSQATWQSTNTAVATVSTTGVVSGVGLGTADISALYQAQTGRRTVTVNAANWNVQVSLTSLTVLESCDDIIQGASTAELAYKVSIVQTNGSEIVLADSGYPGRASGTNLSGAVQISTGQPRSLGQSRTLTLPGRAGEFVRVEFRATEWDESLIPLGWVRDSRMNDRLGTRTHSFAGNAWSNLGTNSITLGESGCRVRLDYRTEANRQ